MAYFNGDMDNEPDVDRMDMEYTLYVNSLPVELNEDGIRDIFGQYGAITGMFHPRKATWAYITYGTYREAEFAIRELDNKKPLYLKVALAKERSSGKGEQKSNISGAIEKPKVNVAESLPIHNDIKYQSMGHGKSIPLSKPYVIPQVTPPYKYADGSLPYSQTFGIEIEDPHVDTNKLWTRGMITVTPDGRRHVSLGRGYTLYEFPNPYPKIEECITKIYEQRNNGLYEYSEDELKSGVQNCSVCSTKTVKHCEKCHTYYCSKACQLEDWPQHQAECEHIPALVEDFNNISLLRINQDVNQTKTTSVPNVINKTAKSPDVKLRRPNTINAMNNIQARYSSGQQDNVSQVKMTDQSVVNTTNTKEFSPQHRLRKHNDINENTDQLRKNGYFSGSTEQGRHNRSYESDSNRVSLNQETYGSNNVRDKTYNNSRNHPRKNDFQNDKASACHTNIENTSRQEPSTSYNSSMNDFYKDTHLSKTKFTMVEIIIRLNNNEYWISKVEDEAARIDLMQKLQNVAIKSRNVQPIIGEVYGVLYETLWHRAMVISLNPVKVHFIDFGNDEILKKDDDIKNIGDLIKAPKFARKIRLTQGTSDKYRNLQEGDKISVKMLSVNSEKTMIVEMQEQLENLSSHIMENDTVKKLVPQENQVSPNKNIQAPTIQIPNIVDALAELLTQKAVPELRIEGVIQFWESAPRNIYSVYSVTLIPQIYSSEIEMIFNDLQEDCSKVQVPANYKPKAEELVCGKCSDGWYRGYISVYPETSNLSIITIDEARIQSASKILPCPKKYSNICAFGVMCEINQSAVEVQVGNVYKFTTVVNQNNPKQESLKIEIIIDSKVIQAVIRPWKSITSSSMPVLKLKNGSKICLTSYRSHYSMFVRSLDEEQVEYYNYVMQTVARYVQTAPHLTEPPVHQQIVIAPFEDGNNYRAMVLRTENDKAKIVYIDFGNIDEINVKDLKVMPQCGYSLKQTCARIALKDVPHDVPSNQEVDLYIRNLLGKEVPLVCTYEGTSPKDGVCLTTSTGECVNDKINQLLIPGWKKDENDDNKCYMLHHIKTANLGRVGDTVDVFVLYVRKDNQTTYMMAPHDIELITHITNVMPAMLAEYCEKTEYYIPRMEELCLALYDGAWYRAACLDPKESHQTSQILFIDYGNIETVEHKNIRLMPKDFIIPEAIANLCTVVNLAPVDSNGNYSEAVQKKLAELVSSNSSITIKIVECCEIGVYKIELPSVRNVLIRDGLI